MKNIKTWKQSQGSVVKIADFMNQSLKPEDMSNKNLVLHQDFDQDEHPQLVET